MIDLRRLGFVASATACLLAATPGVALAHGIGGRLDLPIPVEYVVFAGAGVLVISFVALAVLWPEPRYQFTDQYPTGGLRVRTTLILRFAGLVGLLLVVGQLVPELMGSSRDPTRPTIAPVLVWVVFWLVIPFGSAAVGNWYADINPWRTLPVGRGERQELLSRLGVWPAALLLVAFTWLELISPSSSDPVTLGYVALGYTLFLAAAMVRSGKTTGLQVFDPFTSMNRLFSALAPIGRRSDGKLIWRGWLRSLAAIPAWPGLAVFVVAMIGTVSFDGASGTEWFASITGSLLDTRWGQTLLLLVSVSVIGVGYWLACDVAVRLSGSSVSTRRISRRFAHTLVPIALAYAFSHYFTLVLFEGQQLIAAISDPFALGWDLFGTAGRKVNFFLTSSTVVWYIQVASIVVGHVLGVVLAHDRALVDFGHDAVRSQYAMLVLMIGLTSLALLILAG